MGPNPIRRFAQPEQMRFLPLSFPPVSTERSASG